MGLHRTCPRCAAGALAREGAELASLMQGDGFIPWHDEVPTVGAGEDRYWLLVVLRVSALDAETLSPIGQLTPVPPIPQYPPGLPSGYLSGDEPTAVARALFAPIPVGVASS